MAKVHNNQQDIQAAGIKLFGKTITVPEKQEKDDQRPANEENDDDDGDSKDKKPEKIIACPRCKSMETKFCYFNNYNVNQPRHFCKGCQRYWTAGGALRNVPVGAGRRKMKPPCIGGDGVEGFSEGGLFDHDNHHIVGSRVQQFEWHMVGSDVAVEGDFRHVFPAKRRRA